MWSLVSPVFILWWVDSDAPDGTVKYGDPPIGFYLVSLFFCVKEKVFEALTWEIQNAFFDIPHGGFEHLQEEFKYGIPL